MYQIILNIYFFSFISHSVLNKSLPKCSLINWTVKTFILKPFYQFTRHTYELFYILDCYNFLQSVPYVSYLWLIPQGILPLSQNAGVPSHMWENVWRGVWTQNGLTKLWSDHMLITSHYSERFSYFWLGVKDGALSKKTEWQHLPFEELLFM